MKLIIIKNIILIFKIKLKKIKKKMSNNNFISEFLDKNFYLKIFDKKYLKDSIKFI